MSQPTFPINPNDLTRNDAVNQVISSIAMEELGLSHIINAEGEKLQYLMGTISGLSGPSPTIDQMLQANESVQKLLQTTAYSQMFLNQKLENVLNAPVETTPGGTGGTGTLPAGSPLFTAANPANIGTAAATVTMGGHLNFTTTTPAAIGVTVDPTTNTVTINSLGGSGGIGITGATGSTGAAGATDTRY